MLHLNKKNYYIIFSALILVIGAYTGHYVLTLPLARERVERYYESGQYEKDLDKIVARAIKHFDTVPATRNALVLFDIDDTILSDYANEKTVAFNYIPKLFKHWIMKADAPAIPQTKRLYDYLVDRGFHIIFLTGRKHDEYDATLKNLNDQGFTTFDQVIVRQPEEEKLTAQTYKTQHRKQLIKQGYTIVGSVGDQWSDFMGGYSGYRVKLPNFRYFLP